MSDAAISQDGDGDLRGKIVRAAFVTRHPTSTDIGTAVNRAWRTVGEAFGDAFVSVASPPTAEDSDDRWTDVDPRDPIAVVLAFNRIAAELTTAQRFIADCFDALDDSQAVPQSDVADIADRVQSVEFAAENALSQLARMGVLTKTIARETRRLVADAASELVEAVTAFFTEWARPYVRLTVRLSPMYEFTEWLPYEGVWDESSPFVELCEYGLFETPDAAVSEASEMAAWDMADPAVDGELVGRHVRVAGDSESGYSIRIPDPEEHVEGDCEDTQAETDAESDRRLRFLSIWLAVLTVVGLWAYLFLAI